MAFEQWFNYVFFVHLNAFFYTFEGFLLQIWMLFPHICSWLILRFLNFDPTCSHLHLLFFGRGDCFCFCFCFCFVFVFLLLIVSDLIENCLWKGKKTFNLIWDIVPNLLSPTLNLAASKDPIIKEGRSLLRYCLREKLQS